MAYGSVCKPFWNFSGEGVERRNAFDTQKYERHFEGVRKGKEEVGKSVALSPTHFPR